MANLFSEAKLYFNRVDSAVRKLVIINIAVFVVFAIIRVTLNITQANTAWFTALNEGLSLSPLFLKTLTHPWTFITYAFMHAGFWHILFNMLWLFWMGNILQEFLGNRKIYIIYLLGAICGGILFVIAHYAIPSFRDNYYPLVGASASILAIAVAAATLLPHYEVNLFLFGFVKLKWIVVVLVVLDLISLDGSNGGGHISHLGGAAFGFLYIRYLRENTVIDRIDFSRFNVFKRRKKKKVYETISYMKVEKPYEPDQEEIDAILDKISSSGYESLTKAEKEILFRASQKKD